LANARGVACRCWRASGEFEYVVRVNLHGTFLAARRFTQGLLAAPEACARAPVAARPSNDQG
jgi:hypothetical protein